MEDWDVDDSGGWDEVFSPLPDWLPREDKADLRATAAQNPQHRSHALGRRRERSIEYGLVDRLPDGFKGFPVHKMLTLGIGIDSFWFQCEGCGARWNAPIGGDGKPGSHYNKCSQCGKRSRRCELYLKCEVCGSEIFDLGGEPFTGIPMHNGWFDPTGIMCERGCAMEKGRKSSYSRTGNKSSRPIRAPKKKRL